MKQTKRELFTEIQPKDYILLTEEERKAVCLETIKITIKNLALIGGKELTQIKNYKNILEFTIKKYEEVEEYESCLILKDMLEMVDEL